MGVTQWLQTKMNPAPADPVQARCSRYMPLIFTFMFATFPAGLVIYYTWNNLLSIAQQYVMMRRQGVEVHLFKNLRLAPAVARLKRESGGRPRSDAQTATRRTLEAARKLFAGSVRIRLGRGNIEACRRRAAGDRLCRPLQCRQVEPASTR